MANRSGPYTLLVHINGNPAGFCNFNMTAKRYNEDQPSAFGSFSRLHQKRPQQTDMRLYFLHTYRFPQKQGSYQTLALVINFRWLPVSRNIYLVLLSAHPFLCVDLHYLSPTGKAIIETCRSGCFGR